MNPPILAYRRFPEPKGTEYFAKDLSSEQDVVELFDYCQILEAIIFQEGWNYLKSRFGINKLFELNQLSGWLDCETIEEFLEDIKIQSVAPKE